MVYRYSENYFPKVAGHGQNMSKNDNFGSGCRWFQLYLLLISVILFSNQNHPCGLIFQLK